MSIAVDEALGPRSAVPVQPWADPVIERIGHDPRSSYVERFWLSILGPSTTFLLRRLANRLEREPDGFVLDLSETARAIGLGGQGRPGKQSPFVRAISRSCQFGLARYQEDALVVRRRLPPLTFRQVQRLPESLQIEHRSWQDEHAPPAAAPAAIEVMRNRAQRLALTLAELGEDFDGTERQLHRWRFHPAIAHEAAVWAHEQQAAAR
jgi:hypothetical protein